MRKQVVFTGQVKPAHHRAHAHAKPGAQPEQSVLGWLCSFLGLTTRVVPYGHTLTAREREEEAELRKRKLNILIYLGFALLFAIVVLGNRPGQTEFWMNRNIDNLLVKEEIDWNNRHFATNFDLVHQMDDVLIWVEDVLVAAMFSSPQSNEIYGPNSHAVFGSNILVGNRVRMKQVRVRAAPCERTPKGLELLTEVCWPSFSDAAQSKESYGPQDTFVWQQIPSKYSTSTSAHAVPGSYPAEGFIYDLGPTAADARAVIAFLANNEWLDVSTRALTIDLSLYNPNTQLFLVVQFLFEFPATGGVFRKYSARLVKVWRNMSGTDAVFGFLEIIFMLYVLYYVFREVWEMLTGGVRAYTSDPWNVMDFINYVIFIVAIVFRIMYGVLISDLEIRDDRYVDLQKVASMSKMEDQLMAMNAFFTFFKMFQYLALFPKLSLLFRTLSNAATDMVLFFLLFGVCFWGFQTSFHLAFGSDLPEYKTLLVTAFTLIRLLMGDYDFEKMYEVNSFLAPVLFISFTVLAVFILINMFLAILNDSLLMVKDQIVLEMEEKEAAERQKDNAADDMIDELLNNDTEDEVRLEEMVTMLMRKGLGVEAAREKAQVLLDEYDVDQDGILSENEMRAIRQHIVDETDVMATAVEESEVAEELGAPATPIDDHRAQQLAQEQEEAALFGNIVSEVDLVPLEEHQAKALVSLGDKLTKMVDRSDALAEYTHVGPTTNRTVNVYKNVRWKLGMLSRAISGDNPSEHWSDDEGGGGE